MRNKKYKVNLIGCGRIGYLFEKTKSHQPLSHFAAILSSPSFQLDAVCDKDERVLNEIYVANKDIAIYTNHIEMLEENKPDLIVIASPDDTHKQMIVDSLSFCPKIIFAEKPLVRNFEEHRELTKALEGSSTQLIVNFSRRFNPLYDEILSKKNITKIIIKFSGTFLHNGIHFFDLILQKLGNPDEIEASQSNSLCFKYQGKMDVHFINIKDIGASVEEIEIYGGDTRYLITNSMQVVQTKIPDPNFKGFSIFDQGHPLEFKFQDELKNAYCCIESILAGNYIHRDELEHNKKLLEVIFDNEK